MPLSYTEEQLPFTPPPYYVHKKDLPRPRNRNDLPREHGGEASSIGTVLHKISMRRRSSESEGRVAKTTRKRPKPGLSINTNVHGSTRPPREITNVQPVARQPASIPVFQAPPNVSCDPRAQYTDHGQSRFSVATNSPSRFPSTYLSVSRTSSQQTSSKPQDLFFAPPPRPSSSVYSRSVRNSMTKRDSLRKFASRNTAIRESGATAFEEDFVTLKRQRTLSNDTTFEEDEPQPQSKTEKVHRATPHRSRGWWNVVTTPFVKTPREQHMHAPMELATRSDSGQEISYPPVPVPPIPGQFQKPSSNTCSIGSIYFSPSDQEIPIALGGDLMVAVPSPVIGQAANSTDTFDSNTSSMVDMSSHSTRMPFADVEKSPAAATEVFSPVGLVAGTGEVACARAAVMPHAIEVHEQSRNGIIPEQGQARHSARASFLAAAKRTVRFITPRSSIYPPPPGQYTASREQRFDPPPTPYYRKDSVTSFDECKDDDIKTTKRSNSLFSSSSKSKTMSRQKTEEKDGKKKKMSRRRKCCLCCLCITITLLVLLALIIVLAILHSRKNSNSTSNQTSWIRTANFPPMIIGTLTVARPNLVSAQSGCVNPSTTWSCAVPKEQQAALAPNEPNQPNFVFNVRFDNSSGSVKRAVMGPTLQASHVLRTRAFSPSPPVPSLDDQKFLGNTTDKNAPPFEGESTPFYISFTEPGSSGSKVKRQATSTQSANSLQNLASNIPLPPLNPDKTPGPANLLPFPKDQPLRLFNRDRNDEHYGFYTYYQRDIFLRSSIFRNNSADIVASDLDGGSTQQGANSRCTWTDVRFLVQIWTKRANGILLSKTTSSSKQNGGNFKRPGTFPYPITITIDRHGGGLNTKMLYCFGLDEKGRVVADQKSFSGEQRDFNGSIINPAPGPDPSSIPKVSIAEGGPGGIDGGTSGCSCTWQNWA